MSDTGNFIDNWLNERSERERYIRRVETELRNALDEVGIKAEVRGRAKLRVNSSPPRKSMPKMLS